MSWRDKAACRGQDPNLWHPDPRQGSDVRPEAEETTEARAVCFACPVRVECLANAVVSNEALGVWGGTVPAERVRLRAMLRTDSRWSHLPDDAPHPVQRVVLGLSRPQRRRLVAEELAQRKGQLAYGEARRLADRFGVSEASISLDLSWLRQQEQEAS